MEPSMTPTGIMFLVNHLAHLHRATADGLPVKGYFHGSLMDNFEGSDGFTNRFGSSMSTTGHRSEPQSSARQISAKPLRERGGLAGAAYCALSCAAMPTAV
jgi:hypothetical protein